MGKNDLILLASFLYRGPEQGKGWRRATAVIIFWLEEGKSWCVRYARKKEEKGVGFAYALIISFLLLPRVPMPGFF